MWLSKHDCFKEISMIPTQPIGNIIVLHSLIDNHAITNRYYIQSGPQKTVPYVILFKKLLHLLIRTKSHTI